MDALAPYSEQLYTVLLFISTGVEEEEIVNILKEEKLDQKTIDFILQSGQIIAQETEKHFDKITALIEETDVEDEDEDPHEPVISEYLRSEGVNEELIEHIYVFVILIISKANAETIIKEGRAAGKTEAHIKADIVASGQDQETVDTVYRLASIAIDSSIGVPPVDNRKLAGKHAMRSILWFVIGTVAFMAGETSFFPFMAIGVGLLFLALAIFRYNAD